MKVTVDYDLCEGHEVCAQRAPTIFRIGDDDEHVHVINDSPDEALRDQVVLAVRGCPISAINLTD